MMKYWQVFKFRVALDGADQDIWREIELLSTATVADLAAAILAAFETWAYHLWYIRTKNRHYEYTIGEPPDEPDFKVVDPETAILGKCWKRLYQTGQMEYDYGSRWLFNIQLVDERLANQEIDFPSAFPRLTAGAGKRIIEDLPAFALTDMVTIQKAGGSVEQEAPDIFEMLRKEDEDWYYQDFDKRCVAKKMPEEAGKIAVAYNLAQDEAYAGWSRWTR